MLKRAFGLASLLLLLIFLGVACTPAASQKDLQDLQFQVQALSTSLASTQNSLLATQEALRSVQNQNQQLQNQLAETTLKCSTCDKAAQTCVSNNVATQSGYVCLSSNYYPYTCSCQLPCQYPSACTPLCYSPSLWLYTNYYLFPHLYCPHRNQRVNHQHVPPCPKPHPSPCPKPHPSPCPDPHPSPCPGPHHVIGLPQSTAVEATADTVATEPMVASAIITGGPPATALLETTEPALLESTGLVVTDSAEPVLSPETSLATYPMPIVVPDPVLETAPPAPDAMEPPVINEFTTEPAPPTLQTIEAASGPTPDPVVEAAPSTEIVAEPAPAMVPDTMPVIPPAPAITESPVVAEVPAVPEPPILEVEEAIDETNGGSTL